MKRIVVIVAVLGLLVVASENFSQASISKTADDALLYVVTMKSDVEKQKYLLNEAELFLEKEQYVEAEKVARHILRELDNDSSKAEMILHESMERLKDTSFKRNPINFSFGGQE